MTLYEIDSQITALIDPESGEIADYEAFERLQMDRQAKIENVALWVKDLDAEAKAIREEEKALAERRRVAENKADRLREYLRLALNGEKFSTPKVAVSYRKSIGVMIDDEEAFLAEHPEYARVKTEIDKASLKDALKSGAEVVGAALEERVSMQIK